MEMDLVDIDKVLDDLELNETSSNVSPSTSTAAIIPSSDTEKNNSKNTSMIINNSLEHNNIHDNICSNLLTDKNDETDHQHNNQQHYHHNNQHVFQNLNQNKDNIIKKYLDDSGSSIQNKNISMDDDRVKNKKFVTVSNVFSSLDDYRRDVESLQQPQQHQTKQFENDEQQQKNQEQNKYINMEESSLQQSSKQSEDIGNDNDNNYKVEFEKSHTDRQNKESWKHGKQHKHHQHQNQNEDDEYTEDEPDDIGQTSSSSITTSSPSSFSSGPSPGSPSESCSFVLGQDNNKESVDEEDDVDDNRDNRKTNEEMKVDKEQHNLEKELEQNSNEINEKQQQHLQKQQQQQQRNDGINKESSELGLSSISSYLYCENVSSSLPCSSQDIKLDALSSISSSQTTQNIDLKNNDNENLILNAEKKQKQLHGDNSIHKTYSAQKQQKVVGFGSTMDEISDTELDSILQEIDNDFQMYYVPPTATIATTDDIPTSTSTDIDKSTSTVSKAFLSSSKSNILEPDDSIKECSTNNVEKANMSFSNRSESDELIEEDRITGKSGSSSGGACGIEGFNNSLQYLQITPTVEDENNLQNADSFSQASTIEFAELRLQTDFDTDVNDEKSANAITTNSNTVSDQTVELATSSSILAGNDCVLKNTDEKDHIVLEHQQHENSPNNDVKVDKVAQGDNSAMQHIQRPNSLDLPTQMDVKMYINSTAGQTPPASRLDDISLLSTSSSDDQHLSSSEQFGISSSGAYNQSSFNNNGNQSQQQDINSPVSSSHRQQLGKVPPFWIPDNEAPACMRCKQKFSLIKRRHHCRACGKVLCSVCCSQKAKLPFIKNAEARVCIQCSIILNGRKENEIITDQQMPNTSDSTMNITSGNASILKSSEHSIDSAGAAAAATSVTTSGNQSHRSPNPNNPMEYCSMISPYQQVGQQAPLSPISVMVPVGVLKREGAPKSSRKDKNVIFSDGIRPGCDLTELDNIWDTTNFNKKTSTSGNSKANINSISGGNKQHQKETKTIQFSYGLSESEEHFIPKEEYGLPPICISNKNEIEYKTVQNNAQLIERLKTEKLKFSIRKNLYVHVKIVKLKCCVNKTIINFTSEGLRLVGQDEIIILLELDNSDKLQKDIFVCVNELYNFCTLDVDYATRDLDFIHGSDESTGFLFIRPTFQCLQEIYLPEPPFLIGILINRSEVKWARGFPLRLMLRLGAEYRYYPCPHISIRERKSVYGEIAQTILNFLIDFGHYSYGLRTIKGMYIHMEDRKTNILIPKDSYDEVIKALNDSSDHILALGANFSKKADGHLVCIQNMEPGSSEIHTYSTQAINIQGQARKVTGASFIVFNGALKTTSGLTGKCNIVEDGLMVQILPAKMQAIRSALRNMRDYDIVCGPNDADESQTEIVSIKWTTNDTEVNIGVKSPIDGKIMDGIKSIRAQHNYYSNKNYSIHFLEIFLIQCDNNYEVSFEMYEIANSALVALASYLDLLAANGCHKIGLRVTLHRDNECYEAGSNYTKLPPLYMNALDNELVPVLQKKSIQSPLILELIFCIVNK